MSASRRTSHEPYKRAGSPFWYYDVVDHLGARQRRSTKTADRREALRVIAAVFSTNDEKAKQKGTEITLADVAASYVAHLLAEGRASSADVARRVFNKILGLGEGYAGRFRLDPAAYLSTVSKRTIEALKNARAVEGNSPGTVRLELSILRAAHFYAMECEHLGAQVVKWALPRGREKERSLSVEEAERLLRELDPNLLGYPPGMRRLWQQDAYDLCLTLLYTGGRWAEVASLTWGQVDFARGTIKLFGFKTGKARTVPMIDRVAVMLKRRSDTPRGALVFPSQGRGAPKVRGQCGAIVAAIDRAGLNGPEVVAQFGRANVHTLRHTYATWLRQRGLGLDDIQPLMGHASLMTTRRYARVNGDESFAKAAKALRGE